MPKLTRLARYLDYSEIFFVLVKHQLFSAKKRTQEDTYGWNGTRQSIFMIELLRLER